MGELIESRCGLLGMSKKNFFEGLYNRIRNTGCFFVFCSFVHNARARVQSSLVPPFLLSSFTPFKALPLLCLGPPVPGNFRRRRLMYGEARTGKHTISHAFFCNLCSFYSRKCTWKKTVQWPRSSLFFSRAFVIFFVVFVASGCIHEL